jgi:Family of unknown function (DUF6515)
MKSLRYNLISYKKPAFILFVVFTMLFTCSVEANAQGRGHGGRGVRGSFGHFPHHSFGIAGGRYGHYFAPRIGARVRFLPPGYIPFWVGGFEYYYYDGLYYQYFPTDKVYVVINKPSGADTAPNLKFDQVKIYDGSTLEGIFEGGTDSTITLRVGNEDHDININDVVSITFAPSIEDSTGVQQDSTQQK